MCRAVSMFSRGGHCSLPPSHTCGTALGRYGNFSLTMSTTKQQVLLRKQRNDLLTALQSNGFSPGDFLLMENEHSASLNHQTTQYFFKVGVGEGSVMERTGACRTFRYSVFSSPGRERFQETQHYWDWNDVMRGFQDWVTCLTTELNTSDLWSTVSGDTQLLKMASDQDNKPFTPDEELQIKKALDRIKWVLTKCYALAGPRLETIEARLSYLQECVTRVGRKDFVHITIGILVNTRELFQCAGHHLEPLLRSLTDPARGT